MKHMEKIVVILLLLMGFYHFGFGAYAYFLPAGFYEWASYKGLFNQHFIQDVGAAYLTVGSMLVLSALYRKWRAPLTLAAGTFIAIHGLLHIYEALMGLVDIDHLEVEVITVFIPTVIVLSVSFYSARNANDSNASTA